MAKSSSSVYGFSFRKSMVGTEHPGEWDFVIANSAAISIGDLVRVNTSGYLVRAAAGEAALGVCVGLVDSQGLNVFGGRSSGTGSSTLAPDDTITVAADNQTVAMLKAKVYVDIAGTNLYFNDADEDLAQTRLFQFFDVAAGASGRVDTSTGSDANGQVQLMVLDPDGDGDASKGLFRIAENQFGSGIDSATAKVAA